MGNRLLLLNPILLPFEKGKWEKSKLLLPTAVKSASKVHASTAITAVFVTENGAPKLNYRTAKYKKPTAHREKTHHCLGVMIIET
jgi:hypothetical protein